MTKKRLLSSAAIFAALFFLLALPTSAQCDPAEDPTCRLSPLQSRQVNPAASLAEGEISVSRSSGAPEPLQLDTVDLPLIAADSLSRDGSLAASSERRAPSSSIGPSTGSVSPPHFESINLRMCYQDPSDVSCGVQALGMALDGLRAEGLEAPSSSALLGFLDNHGMVYDFGTGVEELAYAAGSFGFKGTQPFRGWSMEALRAELVEARPVVVALGSNGAGQPGHFVTVTGLFDDGQWISYNDPTRGKVTTSVEEFQALWALQGNSGVAVRSPSLLPPNTPDFTPLLALLAGIMALISATPLGQYRLGVGGRLMVGSGGSSRRSTSSRSSAHKSSKQYKKPAVKKPKSSKKKKKTKRKKSSKKTKSKAVKKDKTVKAKSPAKISKPSPPSPAGSSLAAWKAADMAEVSQQQKDEPHPADRKFTHSPYTRQDDGADMAAWKQKDIVEVDQQLTDDPHPADRKFASAPYTRQDQGIDMAAWKQRDMAEVGNELEDGSTSARHQPSQTPSIEELEIANTPSGLLASLNADNWEEGISFSSTFIDDNPYSIDSSYGPSAGVGSIVLWLQKALSLLYGQLGIWDLGRYLNSQPHNVSGQLSYQESVHGTIINSIDFANHSGSPIKAAITIETSNAQRYALPSEWINPGSNRIEIESTTIGDPGNLAPDESAVVNVTLIAGYNDPVVVRFLSFQVPNED